jgi:hypothetical protein
MARLRVRIELSRGGVGVPLHKLAAVVDEAEKFLHMLGEDVHIENSKGGWLGFDFDHESLNFTAEFVGPVRAEQVRAFYDAFDGTTSLRRATIVQFARITDAIAEEELIGFGLYQTDEDREPSEWRCLSRRDALRITDEIDILLEASEEQESPSHLPAVSDADARVFGRVRESDSNQADSNLAGRLANVERRVEQHSAQLDVLRVQSAAAGESFRNLLSTVENFCDQATHQIERVTPRALLAAPTPAPAPPRRHFWAVASIAAVVGAGLVFAALSLWLGLWPLPKGSSVTPRTVVAVSASAPVPLPVAQPPQPAPRPRLMHLELTASEPTWISLMGADRSGLFSRLLVPGQMRSVEVDHAATLRTGNAGGLRVALDGKPLGPIGAKGQVREIEFKDGVFKITSP